MQLHLQFTPQLHKYQYDLHYIHNAIRIPSPYPPMRRAHFVFQVCIRNTRTPALLQRLSERQNLGAAAQQLLFTLQPTLPEHLTKVLCNVAPVVGLIEVAKPGKASIKGQPVSQLN